MSENQQNNPEMNLGEGVLDFIQGVGGIACVAFLFSAMKDKESLASFSPELQIIFSTIVPLLLLIISGIEIGVKEYNSKASTLEKTEVAAIGLITMSAIVKGVLQGIAQKHLFKEDSVLDYNMVGAEKIYLLIALIGAIIYAISNIGQVSIFAGGLMVKLASWLTVIGNEIEKQTNIFSQTLKKNKILNTSRQIGSAALFTYIGKNETALLNNLPNWAEAGALIMPAAFVLTHPESIAEVLALAFKGAGLTLNLGGQAVKGLGGTIAKTVKG